MKNRCDECYWMFGKCSNEKSPNFLIAKRQCTVKCDYFEAKPDGMQPKNKG